MRYAVARGQGRRSVAGDGAAGRPEGALRPGAARPQRARRAATTATSPRRSAGTRTSSATARSSARWASTAASRRARASETSRRTAPRPSATPSGSSAAAPRSAWRSCSSDGSSTEGWDAPFEGEVVGLIEAGAFVRFDERLRGVHARAALAGRAGRARPARREHGGAQRAAAAARRRRDRRGRVHRPGPRSGCRSRRRINHLVHNPAMRRAGKRRWLVRGGRCGRACGVVGGAAAIVLSTRGDAAQRRSQPDPAAPAAGVPRRLARGRLRRRCTTWSRPTSRPRSRTASSRHEYRDVARTASMTGLRAEGRLHATPAMATVPVSVATTMFGRIPAQLQIPLVRVRRAYRVAWTPALAFPGLLPGETLESRVHAPEGRGRILARDGTVLAEGPSGNRAYPAGTGVRARHRVHPLAGGARRSPPAARPAGRRGGSTARAGSRSRSMPPWAACPACGSSRRRRPRGARPASWPGSRAGSPRTS